MLGRWCIIIISHIIFGCTWQSVEKIKRVVSVRHLWFMPTKLEEGNLVWQNDELSEFFPWDLYVKLWAQLIEAVYLIDTASRVHVSFVMCHAVAGHAIPIKWCLGSTTIVKVSSEATTSLSIRVMLQGSLDLKLLYQHCRLISSSCAVGLLWLPETRVSGDDRCVHLLASINHTLVALFLLHSIVFDSAS